MPNEAQLRLLDFPLAVEPGIGIGGRGMGIVRALLAVEVPSALRPPPRRSKSTRRRQCRPMAPWMSATEALTIWMLSTAMNAPSVAPITAIHVLAETASLAFARATANRSPRAAFREVPGDDLHAVG